MLEVAVPEETLEQRLDKLEAMVYSLLENETHFIGQIKGLVPYMGNSLLRNATNSIIGKYEATLREFCKDTPWRKAHSDKPRESV